MSIAGINNVLTGWVESHGSATVAPLLLQPTAPDDVPEILVEIATSTPQGRYRDVAGPAAAARRGASGRFRGAQPITAVA